MRWTVQRNPKTYHTTYSTSEMHQVTGCFTEFYVNYFPWGMNTIVEVTIKESKYFLDSIDRKLFIRLEFKSVFS